MPRTASRSKSTHQSDLGCLTPGATQNCPCTGRMLERAPAWQQGCCEAVLMVIACFESYVHMLENLQVAEVAVMWP